MLYSRRSNAPSGMFDTLSTTCEIYILVYRCVYIVFTVLQQQFYLTDVFTTYIILLPIVRAGEVQKDQQEMVGRSGSRKETWVSGILLS